MIYVDTNVFMYAVGRRHALRAEAQTFFKDSLRPDAPIVSIAAGTMFLVWLGEMITERGIGNGISLIIFAGIVAGLRRDGCLRHNVVVEGELADEAAFLVDGATAPEPDPGSVEKAVAERRNEEGIALG